MFKKFKDHFIKVQRGKIFCKIGGYGKPLLLLHGYPQNHYMWHKIADKLTENFKVIIPDLRGYGRSMTPRGDKAHINYSKREMAKDMFQVMKKLKHKKFFLSGHDRGARVAHRLARDYRSSVLALSILDICPTLDMYNSTNKDFATGYFHWFFLIQPYDFPEQMIKKNPKLWLRNCLKKWSGGFNFKDVEHHYLKYFKKLSHIHSSCEDYRAGATIDLEHDKKDLNKKLHIPIHVIWGRKGRIGKNFKPIQTWKKYTTNKVYGKALNCNHFVAEEKPKEVLREITKFFSFIKYPN